MSFDAATAVTAVGSDAFTVDIPDGWQQGRGAWGGLAMAPLVRAIEATEPDSNRVIRSVSAQLTAPAVVGPHRIIVTSVRRGSAMSTWRAEMTGPSQETVATMVAITGVPRTSDPSHDHATWGIVTRPVVPAPEAVPVVPGGPPWPLFTQHLRMQPISGLPMAGGPAECIAWVSLQEPVPHSAASLIALVDSSFPASLPLLSDIPRIATVSFMANLLVDPATVPAAESLLSHTFVAAASEGFTSEHRQLFTRDGRLVVDNLQSIVVGA